ncbi:Protein CBG18708 [Caenorhabditis briggsae]|uniref:Protein CBG18708 n=1 Tax=Caenorhabditis briggsae TaxID=6238 RepID=A8XTY5_CAEBR|nr:Protein CBG18708 [Caenorhabditis briggsae]CAP36111.1 Protein CBG18708 [Caenorhabditis briggsae]
MAPQTQPSSSSSRQFTNQIRSLHSIILQRHSSRKAAFSGSVPSSQKSPENRQESTMEKVYRYTRDLALSRDKKVVKRAFERLLQLDCSSQIFKNAKTLKTAIKYPGSTPCFNREIHLLKLKIEKLEKRDQQLNAMEYDPFNPAGMSNFNGQEMDKLMAKFPIYIPTKNQ